PRDRASRSSPAHAADQAARARRRGTPAPIPRLPLRRSAWCRRRAPPRGRPPARAPARPGSPAWECRCTRRLLPFARRLRDDARVADAAGLVGRRAAALVDVERERIVAIVGTLAWPRRDLPSPKHQKRLVDRRLQRLLDDRAQ